MESQLHRHYDDPLHDTGVTDVDDERSHGGETKSAMEKVKAKLEKVKDTINKHSHSHHDREHHSTDTKIVNDSAPVRSGMVQPTEMGTPVLVEDLYATHSDIVDPPTRSFEEWEEEERHGLPPPLPTGMLYGTHHPTDVVQLSHHVYSHDVNNEQIEQLKDPVEKSNVVMEEDIPHNPPNSTTTFSPQTTSGGKEIGITGVLKSFDKMGIYDEPEQHDPNVYTGSHDQFGPEHVESTPLDTPLSKPPNSRQNKQNLYTSDQFAPEHVEYTHMDTISKSPKSGSHDDELAATTEPIANPPLDTIAADPSNPNSSYAQKVTSATCAVADKAVGVKDTIASKLFGENKAAATRKPSFSTTDFAHKVADTMTGTFVPVYEKVVGAVTSKIHGSGHDDGNTREPAESKKVTVREYLVDTFRPGDEDKVLSEVITNAFHRGKGINTPTLQETSTYVAVIDEGERRLQDSTN